MLTELVVEGLGVIDRAELHLTNGSSALTGETGAGKTLLVAALGLLLGARSDKTLVREGADQARVDARFEVPEQHPSTELLREQGVLEPEGNESEIVLSRTVAPDGKSKARINGRPVTLSVLQEVGRSLVEIAGQNEHHELATAQGQRELLDAFAGAEVRELAAQVSETVRDLQRLGDDLHDLTRSEQDRIRQLDVLRFEIKEIEDAKPRAGEIDELTGSAARLEHADAISTALSSAIETLKGDLGIGELLSRAQKDLDTVTSIDASLAPLAERLREVEVEATDITDELSRASVRSDPSALAATRERLSVLTRLVKKYGASEEGVLAYLKDAVEKVNDLESSEFDEERLTGEMRNTEERANRCGAELSARRKVAAAQLEQRVREVLGDLALGDARMKVDLSPRDLHQGGLESVDFLIAANAGETPRPLAKVASGGELSRIALALRLLTSSGTATTLVFDEVDAGVGGAAARSVGRCLAELGERNGTQVLVVTHLPQVAAFADHQFRVSKMTTDDRTSSLVELIEGDARVEELSRMLAGLPESERAREHAQELLELAAGDGSR